MMNEESEDGEGKRVLTINIKSEFAQVGKDPTIQQEDFESHGQGFRKAQEKGKKLIFVLVFMLALNSFHDEIRPLLLAFVFALVFASLVKTRLNSEQATTGEAYVGWRRGFPISPVSLKGKKEAVGKDKSVQEYWQRERNNFQLSKRRNKKRNKKKKNPKKEIVKPFHNQSLGSASPSTSSREFFKISYEIMNELQTVRDKGHWNRFDELVNTLLQTFTNNDEVQIIIRLEKGQAACYNNRPEESEDILEKARNMAISTVNSPYLVARANYYLSALFRRQKKFGKAIDCVELASQNLHHTELVLDTAMLTYERASALMDFILHCDKPDAKLIQRVMDELRKVIDQIVTLKENPRYQCYFKTHRYAFIKIAMLLLDCRTAKGRRRCVSDANIKDAKRSLDMIEKEYWEQTTRGERIQFFLAKADLNFRMKKYEEAKSYARDARDEAKEFGFNTEIKLAEDRLDDIGQSCAPTETDGSHDNSVSAAKHASCSHGNIAPVVEEAMPEGDHGMSSDGMSSEVYNGDESISPGSDSFDSPF